MDQANYYPETLHPLVTASIGGVKTIRTLRSDAPLTVSDMRGSYLPDEAISRLGKAGMTLDDKGFVRNDQRLPYHASQIERVPSHAKVEEVAFAGQHRSHCRLIPGSSMAVSLLAHGISLCSSSLEGS